MALNRRRKQFLSCQVTSLHRMEHMATLYISRVAKSMMLNAIRSFGRVWRWFDAGRSSSEGSEPLRLPFLPVAILPQIMPPKTRRRQPDRQVLPHQERDSATACSSLQETRYVHYTLSQKSAIRNPGAQVDCTKSLFLFSCSNC